MFEPESMDLISRAFIIFCLGGVSVACSPYPRLDLAGTWQACEITEEGQPLQVNPKEVRFIFGEQDRYAYFSTLNYREAGTYYMDNQYLYTMDTLNQASTEKAVAVEMVSPDTLIFLMQENDKKRSIKLVRKP